MKRRVLILSLVFVALVGIVVGVLAMLPPAPAVTKANLDRIEVGMTKAERLVATRIASDATLSMAEWNALIGMTPAQVIERMGKPDHVQTITRLESWHYDSAGVIDPIENTAGISVMLRKRREQPDSVVIAVSPQRKKKS